MMRLPTPLFGQATLRYESPIPQLGTAKYFVVGPVPSLAVSHQKKTAEPARTPPFLLEHYSIRTKVIRTATASERPSVGPGHARDYEPARIPLWPPGQHEVSTNDEPRHQPARPETRPNQRLCVPFGSPPSAAVG
jgi:hypothetical protein